METAAELELRERAVALQSLASVTMAEWTVAQTSEWVGLSELPREMAGRVQTFVEDEQIDGEELENFNAKRLQKSLKQAGWKDSGEVTQALLEQRDLILSQQQQFRMLSQRGLMLERQIASANAGSASPVGVASSSTQVEIGPIVFDEVKDKLGSGRFGFVFRCTNTETNAQCAVKRIEKLRFEAEGGKKEIEVLCHAQATDDGGHRNVIRYITQIANASHVHIVMGLCDETLADRIRRKGLNDHASRLTACTELCQGLKYLHTLAEAITHRDLKPSNLLFKGSVLKIADMGQSRISTQLNLLKEVGLVVDRRAGRRSFYSLKAGPSAEQRALG